MMLPSRKRRPGEAPRRRGPDFMGWGAWLALAIALFMLNFVLTFHNVWPTPWITTRNELSVEIAVLLLALALYAEIVRIPSPRQMTIVATVLLVFAIGRYAEVTAPALYGRPVNLYWDAPHLFNVGTMLEAAASSSTVALVAAGAIGLLVGVFAIIRWSLGRVRAALDVPIARRGIAALAVALIAVYGLGHTSSPLRTLRWYSLPVSMTYYRQAAFTLAAYRQARRPEASLCAQSDAYDLGRLGGADVFVVFMESYGATAYDRADISARLAPARARLAEAVAASGREVASAFVRSPTFGGVSWLAHMTFMTGRFVHDSGTYNLMLTQDCDALPKAFSRSGYRAVSLMPGLKREWPEGAFYGFDTIYGERAIDYQGPEFGWWRIPDQVSLAKLDALELGGDSSAPVFLFFPTISSHMPFRPTPPYQPDWRRVLTAEPFDGDAVDASLAVEPDWTNLGEDYADTIAYTFDYLGGFLRERADLDLVLVVLGDHQPAASVTGEDARWDVPVHVIASRPELIDALVRAGFASAPAPRRSARWTSCRDGCSARSKRRRRLARAPTSLRRPSTSRARDRAWRLSRRPTDLRQPCCVSLAISLSSCLRHRV